jgi:hypothetical protein
MFRLSLGLVDFFLVSCERFSLKKRFQTASLQHCLSQAHDNIIIPGVSIIFHMLIQNEAPLQKLLWCSIIICLDLDNVGLGVFVFMVHWDLQLTKNCIIYFLFLFLRFHSEFCFQLVIEKGNGSRKHNILLFPCFLQNASIIWIFIILFAKTRHLLTFALKGMGVILLCPMHLVTVK